MLQTWALKNGRLKIKHIFHLSTDFQFQSLYRNLTKGLSKNGYEQTVYIQSRGVKEDNISLDYPNVNIVISSVYKKWMKFFFSTRITKIFQDISNRGFDYRNTIVMAYFLLTDGAVALRLYKKLGVPYIVSIRNTDVNFYLKYFPWLKKLAREILINSKKVVFPSPAYIELTKKYLGANFYKKEIEHKVELIGNIIDKNWFSKKYEEKTYQTPLKLIYVGEFSKNKRINKIIKSVEILSSKLHVELTLVGNYGDDCKNISYLSTKSFASIKIINKVDNVERLIEIVDDHDIFIMPSKTETFGMVYVEAMSRGLPIIYTKGQGIDGYFSEGLVGYGVNEPLAENIVNNIERILLNYKKLSSEARLQSLNFTRDKILKKYINMFKIDTL